MRFSNLMGGACVLVCLQAFGPGQSRADEPGTPGSGSSASGSSGAWESTRIHSRFLTEGASAGDVDGDGHVDVVAGPIVFRGPDFRASFEIAAAREFPVSGYSDQFFSHVLDANGDDRPDVLVLGFPGKAARLYLNPGPGPDSKSQSQSQTWTMVEVADGVDNESPRIVELVDGGLPEIVCGRNSQYGYYQAGDDPTKPWTWHAVTRAGACGGRFAHGLGVGDINGDGRADLIDKTFWWEQPETIDDKAFWKEHRWAPREYGGGGAQIHASDIDGDGDADILTSLNAHGHGLAWFEQTGDQAFVEHPILGQTSLENDYGVVFSQLHAVDLVDVNGDGLKDIVTGKRYLAHNGKDIGGLQSPVLYWFQCVRDAASGDVDFVPHLIDDDSGVGVDVLVTDLSGDGKPDIVSSSKRGLTVHLQGDLASVSMPRPWRQTEGRDQTQYADGLEPEQAAKQVLIDDGFTVDLIASEPDLTQPIAMCFDARGRIWVIEGHTYPTKAAEGQGKDRVVFFEDTNADGTFETKRTFIEGINLASGIEVGFGGVWIGAAPEFMFIPDADHDGTPDGPPQTLLDGWGFQDTHETLNSFTWGPDGWLYGCHGVFTHSNVGVPGSPDEDRQRINAGVWRYHPTRHEFEVFAHGTSNPWGVDFNDQGDWFVSACVIPHLYHMIQGGRYQRQAGQHFNPATYDDIKTIADHAHYTGDMRAARVYGVGKTGDAAAADTSILGGGHAHCGLAFYNADVFPPEYRGDLYFHNLHGHRVVRERLIKNGSGYLGHHRPDFALARDHKEIGVGIMVGPDGAIYVSDWHDIQTCHNREQEVWDRTDGRLFRIRYGDVQPQSFDLWNETDEQLVDRLSSDNAFFARQAQRILQERGSSSVLPTLKQKFAEATSTRDRLRLMWTQFCIASGSASVTESDLLAWMNHDDPYVRGWAVQFAGDAKAALSDRLLARLETMAASESSLVVRRYLASLLDRLPHAQRWPILVGLASHGMSAADHNLPMLVWYGLEPLADQSAGRAYELARKSPLPNLAAFTVRRAAQTPAGRDALVAKLAAETPVKERMLILKELMNVATSRGGTAMPADWPSVFAKFANESNSPESQLVRSLSIQFGDQNVFPYFRARFADAGLSKAERLDALASLRTAGDPTLPEQIFPLLGDAQVSEAAVAALSQFDAPEIGERLLERFASFDPATQTAALGTLATRPASADSLVSAMESGVVDPKSVPAFIVQQLVSLKQASLNQRLEKVWGRVSVSGQDKKAEYAKYRGILKPQFLAKANASSGRALYEANCGKCHKLFGVGGDIGPDITGANRTDVNYWLENILEPNALIGLAYRTTRFLTVDGRVIAGMVLEQNEDAVTIQTATEKIVLSQDDIQQQTLSDVSLMPEGQLQTMTDQDVANLWRYLMSPGQVPLASGSDITPTYRSHPDAYVIEGESLGQVKPDQGTVRPQDMRSFGPHWSGGRQLWWTGGKSGATLSIPLSIPDSVDSKASETKTFDVVVFFTRAVDYAQITAKVGDQPAQSIDLFDPTVSLAEPVRWTGVAIKPGSKPRLVIEITGANPNGSPGQMVGIDRIEWIPAGSK